MVFLTDLITYVYKKTGNSENYRILEKYNACDNASPSLQDAINNYNYEIYGHPPSPMTKQIMCLWVIRKLLLVQNSSTCCNL